MATELTGRVHTAGGTATVGDTVAAFPAGGGQIAGFNLTDEGGNFTLNVTTGRTYTLAFYGGDPGNLTGSGTAFPRDGVPDLYALTTANVSGPTDVGTRTLPAGHVVNVSVVDGNGDGLPNVTVGVTHTNATGDAVAEAGFETGPDGRVRANGVDPGVELSGDVTVRARNPYTGTFETRNRTVTGPTAVEFVFSQPSGNLTAAPEPAVAGFDEVNFSVASSDVSDGDFYEWQFGDGGSAFTTHPNDTTRYLYRRPGEYVARVTARNGTTERLIFTATRNVTVISAGSADLVATPSETRTNRTVDFAVRNVTLNVSANVSFYNWQFGDGGFDSGPSNTTNHTYAEPGTYAARVTAYADGERRLFTARTNVTVTAGTALAGPWPMLGHDPARTSATAATGPTDGVFEKWRAPLTDAPAGGPVVSGETLYVATSEYNFTSGRQEGQLYAFNATDGTRRWVRDLPNGSAASPTVAGGVVYVPTTDDRLLGFSPAGVERLNVSDLYGQMTTIRSVAARDGRVFVAGSNGTWSFLGAYDTSGTRQWGFGIDRADGRAPAVRGGRAYFPTGEIVTALNVTGGSVDWTGVLSDNASSAPSATSEYVYVPSANASNGTGQLTALYVANGTATWTAPINVSGPDTTVPAVVGDRVYVGGTELNSFDARTGAARRTDDYGVDLAPLASNALGSDAAGTVYATFGQPITSEQPDVLVAVNATGEVWNHSTYWYRASQPAVAEGMLFTVDDQRVYGLVSASANRPPSALLGANDTAVTTAEGVRLDATDSWDPDGSLVEYRWDVDGDGIDDRTTATSSIDHRYGQPGTYTARVTVVDDGGLTDSDTVTIEVTSPTPAASVGGSWPEFAYDTANTGTNASTFGPVGPVEETWKTDVSGFNPYPPVVANGLAYTTEGTSLRAFHASNGTSAWSTSLYPPGYSFTDDRFDLTSAPTVADGVVYVGGFWNDSSTGTAYDIVYALDARTGTRLWNRSFQGQYDFFNNGIGTAAPKLSNGTLFVSSEITDTVYAVDTATRSTVWSRSVKETASDPGELRAAPAVREGVVYVAQGWDGVYDAGQGGQVYAFDAASGAELWNTSVYGVRGATPAVSGDRLYVLSGTATVALNATNGSEVWSHPASGGSRYASPAVVGDTVVSNAGDDPGLIALNATDGTERWRFDGNGSVFGAPAVAGTRVYVGTDNGYVYGVDLNTGLAYFEYALSTGSYDSAPVYAAPAVVNGTLFVRAGSNQLVERAIYAIGDASGSGAFDATLVATPSTPIVNVTDVAFTLESQSGSPPASYEWRFGDGTTTTTDGANDSTTHTYATPGTYTATVVGKDAGDSIVYTDSATVTASRASGDLVATPSAPNVTVEDTTLVLENVTAGVSPANYEWDLTGDGTTDRTTTTASTTASYPSLGAVHPAVSAFDADGEFLFDASTTVTVVDRVPPTVRASAPDRVGIGAPFVVDASASTDNDRVASYTFLTDEGERDETTSPTGTLNVSTPGTHTVTVRATDPSGNANETNLTVFVTDLPDLTTQVETGSGGTTANVTVFNDGTAAATGVTARLTATLQRTYYDRVTFTREVAVGDLDIGENETVTVDYSTWARENATSAYPDVSVTATADPTGAVDERDETNNASRTTAEVAFTDVRVFVRAPYQTAGGIDAPVRLTFRNYGDQPSSPETAEVDFGDGSAPVTVPVPTLDRYESNQTTLLHAFPNGTHTVTARLQGDPSPTGNESTDRTETYPFAVSLDPLQAPDSVENGSTFYVRTRVYATVPSDINVTLDLPDGLEATSPTTRTFGDDAYAYVSWRVRATEESGASPYDVGVSATARGASDAANASVEVTPRLVRVDDTATVALTDTGTGSANLDVRPETTFEHSVGIDVQLGAQGRSLAGLDYLFSYPHGCVEQTTSPMLTALNTDEFYRTNPAPGGYDEAKVDAAVATGVQRLSVGADGQHTNGAWSMWGDDPAGDMYYTAYALFGTSSVAADPVQGARPEIRSDLASVDFNSTVQWMETKQEYDGRLANDKSYFDDDYAMTGFSLVALERGGPYDATSTAALARVERNATAFLVSTQRSDGSWDGNAMSTALAVWGLSAANTTAPGTDAAVDRGVAWLLANQGSDGSWSAQRSSSWRSTGVTSETTGYAVLALNESGVSASNTSVQGGTAWLVGTYDEGGSWGYTRASAVAIDALLTIGVDGPTPSGTVNVSLGTASSPNLVERSVTVDESTPHLSVTLTDAELATLRGAGGPIVATVETDGTGQFVVGIENEQVVVEREYLQNTGGA